LDVLLIDHRPVSGWLPGFVVIARAIRLIGAPSDSAELVAPEIHGDLEKPHAGGIGIAKLLPMPPCPQKRLLREVLGAMRIARQAQRESVDVRNVLFQQSPHRS